MSENPPGALVPKQSPASKTFEHQIPVQELPYEEVLLEPDREADPLSSPLAFMGLTEKATQNQIKKRYRELALQYHPDNHAGTGSEDLFKALGNAYSAANSEGRKWTVAERRFDRGVREEIIRYLGNFTYFHECLVRINEILRTEQFADKAAMESRFKEVRAEYAAKNISYDKKGWPTRFDPKYVSEQLSVNDKEIEDLSEGIQELEELLKQPGPFTTDPTTKF